MMKIPAGKNDTVSNMALSVLLLCLLAPAAMAGESTPEKLGFDTVLERISSVSGYDIQTLGQKPDHDSWITGLDNDSLSVKDRLRKVLDKFGVAAYILQEDEANRKIRIIITDPGSPKNPGPTNKIAAEDTSYIKQSELERIKKEHKEKMANRSDDAVISPASEHGHALTLGQLNAAKEEYRANLETQTDETEILPPSEYGNGLTRGELEKVKEKHRIRMGQQNSHDEVLPSSESESLMTLEDLRIAKENHKAALKKQTDDTVVLPASEFGPALTRGELNAVKAEYRARLEEHTQDTRLEILPGEIRGTPGSR